MSETDQDYIQHGIPIRHHHHTGYLYQDSLKCDLVGYSVLQEHKLEHPVSTCQDIQNIPKERTIKVPHLDHFDYLIGNKLYYLHDGHYDDHGEIDLITDEGGEEEKDVLIIHAKKRSTVLKFSSMIFLIGGYFFVELVVGIIINSLTLQADAIHMLSDLIALSIGLYAFLISTKEATYQATYGWMRAETVGALMNGTFLLASCFFITIEAIERFRELDDLEDTLGKEVDNLLIVGGIGLVINLMGICIFLSGHHIGHSHGHQKMSLNMRGVFLHIIGDTLGSVNVIISGLLIKFLTPDERFLADPICSLVIVIIILINVVPLIKISSSILLQKVPKSLDLEVIRQSLSSIEGVLKIHDFHVWQLDDQRIVGSFHVHLLYESDFSLICKKMEEIMHHHKVCSTTIQPEFVFGNDNLKCLNTICVESPCQKCCQ